MTSWLQYQRAFSDLASVSGKIVLELQFGEGAEDWAIRSDAPEHQERFIELCALAGALLPDVHLADHETGSAIAPETRWFRLLRERNNPHINSPLLIDQAGVALSQWTLDQPVVCSAELCIELQRTHPIEKAKGWFAKKIAKDPIGMVMVFLGTLALFVLLMRLL